MTKTEQKTTKTTKTTKTNEASSFILELLRSETQASMEGIVGELVDENDPNKRKQLGKRYQYGRHYEILYESLLEKLRENNWLTIDCSWKNILENGWLCFASLGMFRKPIVEEIGIKAYKNYVVRYYPPGRKGKPREDIKEWEQLAEDAFADEEKGRNG